MTDYKRTGWQVVFKGEFVDILPLDDLREHFTGDECWCIPLVLREDGYLPRITHNSADKRELNEPDNWQERYLGLTDD